MEILSKTELIDDVPPPDKETNRDINDSKRNEEYIKGEDILIENSNSFKGEKNEVGYKNKNANIFGGNNCVEIFNKKPKKTMDFKKNKNKNTKKSVLALAVQEQIDKNFSLDNLGQINLAEDHRSANRPLNKINDFNKQTKFCQCCNLPCIQKGVIEPFNYCDNIKKFAVCGKGIYLYFLYICFALFCFFITILSSISCIFFSPSYYNNIINLCRNNNNPFVVEICKKYDIEDTFWAYKYSSNNIKIYREICLDLIGNKKVCNKSIINYSVINFLSMISIFVFHIVLLFVFYYENVKLKSLMLPSDYTLLITNLNGIYNKFKADNKNQLNIEKFLSHLEEQLFKTKKNCNIHSINICYKINKYMNIQKQCEEYKSKIFHIKYDPYQKKKNEELKIYDLNEKCYFYMPLSFLGCTFSLKKGDSFQTLTKKKHNKESLLIGLMEHGNELNKFAGSIFVTFNTVKDKERYYNKFPHYFIEKAFYSIKNIKNFLSCDSEKRKEIYLKHKIIVQYANEPEDILWENMEFTHTQRILRKLFIYFICFLLLLGLFLIVFSLYTFQNNLNNKNNWRHITINLASYSIALVIVIVNKIFQLLIEYLTKFEKPYSFTHFYLSCSIKLTIFAFITSSFLPFICNTNKGLKDNILMIKNISNLFIINAISLPLPVILLKYYFKVFRIWLIKKNPNGIYITQRELNDLYEFPDMCISYRYSDVCQTILMTFFYIPIFPFGAIISSVGLIMSYLCEKLYFIHFYKRPEMLNESICKFYLEYFTFNIFIYAIGDYIFTNEMYEKNKMCLSNIIIFSIFAIIPCNKFILLYLDNQNLFQINSTIPISKAYFKFFNDYERQNPITKKDGLLKYIKALRDKRLISENVKKIASENVDNINIMEVYYRSSLRYSVMKSQMTYIDSKKKYVNCKTVKNENYNQNYNENNNGKETYERLSNYNKNDNKNQNNVEMNNISNNNNNDIDNSEIIQEEYLKEIIKNNDSLMLCTYKNPFLFGIKESIRASIKPENIASHSNSNKKEDSNTIVEESKEEDLYHNNTGIINIENIEEIESVGNFESLDTQLKKEKQLLQKSFTSKNRLHKSYNYLKGKNNINEFSSNDNLAEIINVPKEVFLGEIGDISKSVRLNDKK